VRNGIQRNFRHDSKNRFAVWRSSLLITLSAFYVLLLTGCATQKPLSTAVTAAASTSPSHFGKYDTSIIEAVRKKWYESLDNLNNEKAKSFPLGKVDVLFHLHPDGSVSDIKIIRTDVGDYLANFCTKAISDSVPFGPWPPDMLKKVNKDYREITFTFHYE
jgi:hypothetical protein